MECFNTRRNNVCNLPIWFWYLKQQLEKDNLQIAFTFVPEDNQQNAQQPANVGLPCLTAGMKTGH